MQAQNCIQLPKTKLTKTEVSPTLYLTLQMFNFDFSVVLLLLFISSTSLMF